MPVVGTLFTCHGEDSVSPATPTLLPHAKSIDSGFARGSKFQPSLFPVAFAIAPAGFPDAVCDNWFKKQESFWNAVQVKFSVFFCYIS